MVIPDHDDLWYRGLKRKSALLKGTRGSVAYVMLIFEFRDFGCIWKIWYSFKSCFVVLILKCLIFKSGHLM